MTAARRTTTRRSKRGKSKAARSAGPALLHVTGMLAIVCGFLALVLLRLANAPVWDAGAWTYLALAGFTLLAWILLRTGARNTPSDSAARVLMISVAFLTGIGVLVQHRVKSIDITAPALADLAYPSGVVVLLLILLLFRSGRYRWLAAPGPLYALAAIAGMAALLVVGMRYRGAVFAAGRMTPTELLKPVMAAYLAWFLAGTTHSGRPRGKKQAGVIGLWRGACFAAAWGFLMALLVWQRDLGMIAILNGMLVFVLFAATSARWLLPAAAIAGGLAVAAATRVLPYVRLRVEMWLDPFRETTGAGWQLLQSLAALYNGGMLGAGFGEGSPQTIPVASSDFIYAAIGEELGFVGCVVLVAVLGALILTGYRIAATCKDRFGSLLATSLTSVLAVQTILNLGGVTKALPLTGVPLPFLSHGGTNLLVSFAIVGLLAAIAVSEGKAKRRKKR